MWTSSLRRGWWGWPAACGSPGRRAGWAGGCGCECQGFAQAYLYGALGGLAGTLTAGMLADCVLPFVYNIGLAGFRASVLGWLFLGGLAALERMTMRGPGEGEMG